jgi:hypothetical protein
MAAVRPPRRAGYRAASARRCVNRSECALPHAERQGRNQKADRDDDRGCAQLAPKRRRLDGWWAGRPSRPDIRPRYLHVAKELRKRDAHRLRNHDQGLEGRSTLAPLNHGEEGESLGAGLIRASARDTYKEGASSRRFEDTPSNCSDSCYFIESFPLGRSSANATGAPASSKRTS